MTPILLILVSLCLAFVSLAFLAWNLKRAVRSIIDTVALNTGGASPMARLIPNVAFLILFLVVLNATWF